MNVTYFAFVLFESVPSFKVDSVFYSADHEQKMDFAVASIFPHFKWDTCPSTITEIFWRFIAPSQAILIPIALQGFNHLLPLEADTTTELFPVDVTDGDGMKMVDKESVFLGDLSSSFQCSSFHASKTFITDSNEASFGNNLYSAPTMGNLCYWKANRYKCFSTNFFCCCF
jgi:hypothetical protein